MLGATQVKAGSGASAVTCLAGPAAALSHSKADVLALGLESSLPKEAEALALGVG